MRDKVIKQLARAGISNQEELAKANHKAVRMALGRDEELIKDAVMWLCDGDPGQAYADRPELRPLLGNLYPGLKEIWRRLGSSDKYNEVKDWLDGRDDDEAS